MASHKDDAGQVMLTSALLFAIIIVIISLMLNNIIYATNVAYIGFMDGSKYEDLSIRQMTTNEAARSYQESPDIITRTKYMSDYAEAINYLTNSKGKFVELTNTFYTAPPVAYPAGLIATQTQWELTITNKGSSAKYLIATGLTKASGPPAVLPEPTVSFALARDPVIEGEAVTVNIILSNPYDSVVTVDYATGGGTAMAVSDYTSVSGTVTFNPGEISKSFTISTVQDTLYEPQETFTVSSTGTNVASIPLPVTVHIDDDDEPPAPTPAPGPAMTVTCTADRLNPDDKKEITIVVEVVNTGTVALTNVQLTLSLPTGVTFVQGVSPYTLGDLGTGATRTYTWKVKTQSQNVNVMAKATAGQIPLGAYSPQLSKI